MDKTDKWPIWVRIYAKKEKKKLVSQMAEVLLGFLLLVLIEYLLAGRNLSSILKAEQIFRYFTILVTLTVHMILINSSHNWVIRNSSFNYENRSLNKWYSYLIFVFIIVLFGLIGNIIF